MSVLECIWCLDGVDLEDLITRVLSCIDTASAVFVALRPVLPFRDHGKNKCSTVKLKTQLYLQIFNTQIIYSLRNLSLEFILKVFLNFR